MGMSDTTLVEVGPKGRVVIPAAIRRQLGIGEGSQLVALVEEGGVMLLPRAEVKRRLRRMFAAAGTSLSAELLRDRRREAEREDRDG
jgi:AbrB family looped-hinge helix DNA binding protein